MQKIIKSIFTNNISKKIFYKNISEKNIFAKNISDKINLPNCFGKKYFCQYPFKIIYEKKVKKYVKRPMLSY